MEIAPELAAGTELDARFRIRDVLGEGGLGCVYLAQDLRTGEEVALKILVPRYRGRPEREARLLQEADLAARIGPHPGLPRVIAAGRLASLGGCPFVAWEVVRGKQLNALLALGGAPPPRVAAGWARQLAEILRVLHGADVVHRDVTVDNVLVQNDHVREQTHIRLIDLSHAAIAVRRADPSERLTRDFEVPGTHRFMAPEQARAMPADPKMDVFAFGVVLYELLTGKNPFGHVKDRETFIRMQAQGALTVPRIDPRVVGEAAADLVELVHVCTLDDAAARPDAEAIVRRLDAALAAMGVGDPDAPAAELGARPGLTVVAPASQQADSGGALPGGEVEPDAPRRRIRPARARAAAPATPVVPAITQVAPSVATVPSVAHEIAPPELAPPELAPRKKGSALGIAVALLVVAVVGTIAWAWTMRAPSQPKEHSAEGQGATTPASDSPPAATDPTPGEQRVVPAPAAPPMRTDAAPIQEAAADNAGSDAAHDDGDPPSASPSPSPSPRPRDAASSPSKTTKPPQPAVAEKPAVPTLSPRDPECVAERERAEKAAVERRWVGVLADTRRAACWSSQARRVELRVRGLYTTQRYADCAREAKKAASDDVRRLGAICQTKLDESSR